MSINITSLTTDQLIQLNQDVVALIKARRRQEASSKRHLLSLGDEVIVEGHGTGIVKKIMRTRAMVELNGRNYKVPMNMITCEG